MAERRMAGKRSLITGGAGFIGSHLADALLARGDHVSVIDNLSTGRRQNLPASHERLRFIEAGLDSALGSFGPGEVFDEIYHLAAAVGVQLVMRDQIGSIETNVGQTAALLAFADRMRERGHDPAVLLASSSEVYGKGVRTPFAEEDDVLYGPTSVGRWSYAASKAIDEYLGLAYARTRGLRVVIARFFNTVGPRQVGDYGMVLPNFVSSALAGRPLIVHGDGRQSRCLCDVRDVVDALPRLMACVQAVGRVFNLGRDEPITIGGLARLVVDELGSSSRIELVPYDSVYPSGFEDLRQRQPDLRRLRSVIEFAPRITLGGTVRDLADWMRAMGAGGAGPDGVGGSSAGGGSRRA